MDAGLLTYRPFPVSSGLSRLVKAILEKGGKPIAVGGCVRDHLLGFAQKDVDVEVYGLDFHSLESLLQSIGTVYVVGKSFAVLKVVLDGETFDVSLPRLENKNGVGHRGFLVTADPSLTFDVASKRRDFTINAMGYDLETGEFLDPHCGRADLHRKVLRHVSDAFSEDPLRVLRACQMVSRFGLQIAESTLSKCRLMQQELSTLPKERIGEEIKKLLFSKCPSLGLHALHQTGALFLFPELQALQGCPQDPEWHPEGDVWTHTLMVVDQAAHIVQREALEGQEALIILLGALCHDLGKPDTTKWENDRWRSKGHEAAGETPTRLLLSRFGISPLVIEEVVPLVQHHLKPAQFYKTKETITKGAIRRLAAKVSLKRLCLVSESDFLGRTTQDALLGHDPSTAWLLEQARHLQVEHEAPEAILKGRHLLQLGMHSGVHIGLILKQAYEAQLEGEFDTLEEAFVWLEHHLQGTHP